MHDAARRRYKELFAKIGDFLFVCIVPWKSAKWLNGWGNRTECTELENCFLRSRKFEKQMTRHTQDFKTLECEGGFVFMVVGVSLACECRRSRGTTRPRTAATSTWVCIMQAPHGYAYFQMKRFNPTLAGCCNWQPCAGTIAHCCSLNRSCTPLQG